MCAAVPAPYLNLIRIALLPSLYYAGTRQTRIPVIKNNTPMGVEAELSGSTDKIVIGRAEAAPSGSTETDNDTGSVAAPYTRILQ